MSGTRVSEAAVEARRERIVELVLERGRVGIGELARGFGVSEMTVHRDLDALAKAGLLAKERGAAVAPSELYVQTSALFRMRSSQRLKQVVAEAALPLVGSARTVLVDDSTSVLPLLALLLGAADGPFTVVTNYLEVLRRVAPHPQVSAHLLGGDYLPDLDATFGPATLAAVANWKGRVDLAVLGAPAAQQGRVYHPLAASAALKLAALDAAQRTILLLNHTKLPRTGPHEVCGVDRFDTVVVDDQTDAAELRALRATGTRVVLAAVDGGG